MSRKESRSASSTPPSRLGAFVRRHRRLVLVLEILFIVSIVGSLLLTCVGGCFLLKYLRDGGYVESWTDGEDGTLLAKVQYGPRDWQIMDVYVPKTFDASKSSGALLFVHGGAWIVGSRREQQGFARRIAKRGYLVANMEYMLYNYKLSKEDKESYSVYSVLDEIDMALAKLKEIGSEHGYDVKKVGISGHSAGGHLAMLYGYRYKTRENGSPCVDVAFIAPRVGPSDFLTRNAWGPETGDMKRSARFVSYLSGEEITPSDLKERNAKAEAALKRISPACYISPETAVPTFAAYAAKDMLVPTTQTSAVTRAFDRIGAKSFTVVTSPTSTTPVFDLLIFPNSNHPLASDPVFTEKWTRIFEAYAARYLDEPTSEAWSESPVE